MATVAQINGRQSTIVAITNDTGRCSVADLAERFCVTAETIRRDLKSLEAKGPAPSSTWRRRRRRSHPAIRPCCHRR